MERPEISNQKSEIRNPLRLFLPACLVLLAFASATLAFSFYFRGDEGDFNLYYFTIPASGANEYMPSDASRILAFPRLIPFGSAWAVGVFGGWLVLSRLLARRERVPLRGALARSAFALAPLISLLIVPAHHWLGWPMTLAPVFLMIFSLALCALIAAYLLGPTFQGRVAAAVCSVWGVVALCITCFLAFAWLSLRQYNCLHLGYVDSGLFAEGLGHAARGGALRTNWANPADPEFTALWGDTGLCFSWHCFFILAPLSWLYRLWPAHSMLLVLQAAALASGGLAVFLIARHVLRHQFAAWCLALAYLIAPTTAFVNLPSSYGFRPEGAIPAVVLWAIYLLERRRLPWFFLLLFVALLIKETVVPIVVMLGVFAALRHRLWLVGAATVALGVGYYGLATQVAIPYVLGRPYAFSPQLRQYGSSASELLVNIVVHPLRFLAGVLGTRTKVFYLLHHLVPVLLLPLLSPTAALVAAASFAMLAMASYYSKFIIPFGQQAEILAGVYLAAAYGLSNLCERPTRLHRWLVPKWLCAERERLLNAAGVGLVAAGALSCYFFFVRSIEWRQFRRSERAAILSELRQKTPRTGSLCASYRLASHFTDQQELYVAPIGLTQADYVVLDLYDDTVALSTMASYRARLLRSPSYGLVYANDGFLIFRRGAPDAGIAEQVRNPKSEIRNGPKPQYVLNQPLGGFATLLGYDAKEADGGLELTLYWRCDKATEDDCVAALLLASRGERRGARPAARGILHLVTHGVLPTWAWRPGDIIEDRLLLRDTPLPPGAPPLAAVRLETLPLSP